MNFVAAHDGLTLADLTSYERKHNEANGEQNRDGHDENLSWNNGVEGDTADPAIIDGRKRDRRAMLSTLFASRGTIMLTAGDEFGRTQRGNNNAYAQDNEVTWLDWQARDHELEAHVEALAAFRKRWRARLGADTRFLDGKLLPCGLKDVEWLSESGQPLEEAGWQQPDRHRLTMMLASPDGDRIAIAVNGDRRAAVFAVPSRPGFRWSVAAGTERDVGRHLDGGGLLIAGRSVVYLSEEKETPV